MCSRMHPPSRPVEASRGVHGTRVMGGGVPGSGYRCMVYRVLYTPVPLYWPQLPLFGLYYHCTGLIYRYLALLPVYLALFTVIWPYYPCIWPHWPLYRVSRCHGVTFSMNFMISWWFSWFSRISCNFMKILEYSLWSYSDMADSFVNRGCQNTGFQCV